MVRKCPQVLLFLDCNSTQSSRSALIGTDYLSSHFRYVDGASYFWAVSLALEGRWSLDR